MKVSTARKIARLSEHITAAKSGEPDNLETWKAKAEVLLEDAGPYSRVLALRGINYSPEMSAEAMSEEAAARRRNEAQRSGVLKAVALLEAAITRLEISEDSALDQPKDGEKMADDATGTASATGGSPTLNNENNEETSPNTEIFIVHGRDEGSKEMVARFLHSLTKKEPVILHEQPSGGATIIEKFEKYARNASYAVVIATGDDVGRSVTDTDDRPRARQNVIFELGYFFGRLGREHVAFLYQPHVEPPSDIGGIAYIELDTNRGWRISLANELEAARFEVDRRALR
jgi:predicted nucleotide-binding protein